MRRLGLALSAFVSLAPVTCARRGASPALVSADGARASLVDVERRAEWTVLVFFSRTCPCMSAHDGRLRALARDFGPKGVRFVAVFSEVGETPGAAEAEARRRGYGFDAAVDEGGRLAGALGAEYATYSVIVSRSGEVVYRGGIDSDKQELHDDATFYVAEVLADLTTGRPPRRSEGKVLGCVLRSS